ncbi:MAG: hypothetical protein JNM46_00275 [Anaerolineales bacterium]|nr:hypothetical protein [Anaerolineales bacterium]
MPHSIEGLSVIANKAPVVGTHVGGFSATSVKQTQERYSKEALTYVRPKEISSYQQRFLDRLLRKKTSIGCIVAPFGYGKTSAAIDTWQVCNENKILTVLPFSCSSIAEMGKAIATGIEHRLGHSSRGAKKVRSAYESYLVSSAKRLAEQDTINYKINYDTALRSIEDKIERGYLHIDATGNHLLGFFEELTHIVVESGFDGLLIIVDEFQQFLGNINKTVITNFRTLVWGLRTRGTLPLGLLITMDPDTERNLSERAGDILHRIKEDNLYLDFTDAYEREFASLLWTKYAQNFQFTGKNSKIVDKATLDSIGQICERHDLSNGPRTVIDIFQRIAHLYSKRQRSYTPVDLIDDFLSGDIRFDGDRSKIASLVTELTSYEYIKTSSKRLQALKLISAFPRGCSKEVADAYGLGNVLTELSDALRGEVLTELPEGIALIDLQRVGKPQNKLNIILKKYWMQITEGEIVTDRAVALFAQYAISAIFPPFRNILSGWSREEPNYRLTPSGSYTQIYEGSFFEDFPRRRIAIEICRKKDQISRPEDSYDFRFVFVLQRSTENNTEPIFDKKNKTFILGLRIDLPFGIPMPRDLRWIEDYLRPVEMSPAVVLSLIDYINSQAPKIDDVTEGELQRIQAYSKKLNDFLISVMFGPELFASLGINFVSRGEQALKQAIFYVLKQIYPDYQTLISSNQWETICKTYIDALKKSNLAQTRGLERLEGEKSEIAAVFGFRNHAGFESQIRQFHRLAVLEDWIGSQGAIRFQSHIGEGVVLKIITDKKNLKQEALFQEARKFGYLPEETHYLLEYLLLRGYIEKDKYGHFKAAQTLSKAELVKIARDSEIEASEMVSLVKFPDLEDLISQKLSKVKDMSRLTKTQIRILEFQRRVQSLRPVIIKEIQGLLGKYRSDLYEKSDLLNQEIPISSTGLFIDAHINGVQRKIILKSKVMLDKSTKLSTTINEMLKLLSKRDLTSTIVEDIRENKALFVEADKSIAELQEVIELINQHIQWVQLADYLLLIKEYIETLKPYVNVNPFVTRYEVIVRKLMEALSVKGINIYFDLYREYSVKVLKLYDEIAIAIKAAKINDQMLGGRILNKASHLESGQTLLKALRRKNVLLKDIVQTGKWDAERLLGALISLEDDGKVKLSIISGKPDR